MYLIIILVLLILFVLFYFNYETEFFQESIKNYKLDRQKKLNLYNIKINNEILDEMGDEPCVGDYNCDDGKGRCIAYDNKNRCFSVIEKEIYEFTRDDKSYIELIDVNSLDINMSFMLILNNLDNQIIVRSELNVWDIKLKDGNLIASVYSPLSQEINSEVLIKSNDTNFILKNSLLKFNIQINKSGLKCEILDSKNITSISRFVSFYKGQGNDSSLSIYKCTKDTMLNCGRLGVCENIYRDNYECEFNLKHKIIFGKPLEDDVSETLKYFDGYIGGFEFGTKDQVYKKQCEFNSNSNYSIRKDCFDDCSIANECSVEDCNEKCKDYKVCGFDAKETFSRHEIDCMTQCIKNKDCPSSYCKKQCFECGSECFWRKNNTFSNNSTNSDTGKPGAVKINMVSSSYHGDKVTVKWKALQPTKPDEEILGYIGFMFKTFKKNEGLVIDKIQLYNCNKYCEYIFSNLIPNETYTIGVRAFNSFGIGPVSNLITFKSQKKTINTDVLNNIEEPLNFHVGNFTKNSDNYCNINEN